MRKIATQLRECADLLQEKAKNLDSAHGTQQLEDVIKSLREHSKVIVGLAGKIESESDSRSPKGE